MSEIEPEKERIRKLRTLSKRQWEVLVQLCKMKEHAEVAENLCISTSTVKTHHVPNIYAKLGLSGNSSTTIAQKLEREYCSLLLKYGWTQDAFRELELGPRASQPEIQVPRRGARNSVMILLILVAVSLLAGVGIMSLVSEFRGGTPGVVTAPTSQAGFQQQPKETVRFQQVTTSPEALDPTTVPLPTVASVQPSPTVAITPSSAAIDLASAGVCGEIPPAQDGPTPSLVREQGVIVFTVKNTKGGLINDKVRSLAIDSRGLWIGYFSIDQNPFNGVGHYDGSKWFYCDHAGATSGDVNVVAVDHAGRIWVAREEDGVAMLDGAGWHGFNTRDGLPSDWTYGITIDEDNNVWVATWEGVAKFDGDLWSTPYGVPNDTLFNDRVHAIAFDSSNNIWVGHISHGVSQYQGADGTWIHHTSESSGLGGDQIRAIAIREADEDSAESAWFATADGGLSRFEEGEWTVYTVDDGLPSDDVKAVAFDKYGRVWATTAGGVAYFDDHEWTIYHTIDTSSIAFGPSCQDCPFDDDAIWTGTAGWGLTYSRLPYPDNAIDIRQVCFVSAERERVCPPLPEIEGARVISITYPRSLAPGEKLRFEIVVAPRSPHQLRQDCGDFLSNLGGDDADLFGVWPLIPVEGRVEAGQPFTFTDPDNPLVAPQPTDGERETTFTSRWRVWMHTRYAGPAINLNFTVRRP
jgi:DNA-binding CsgD family transcriptional regulator/streptogramin lyase